MGRFPFLNLLPVKAEFIFLFAMLLAFAACKKDKTDPVIVMHSPVEGASFDNGDTMWIQAEFSDNDALKETGIIVLKNGVADMDHRDASGAHGHNYLINVTANTDFEVKAIAEDVSGNKAELKRTYNVVP